MTEPVDTRERLLDAAAACFAEQGFWGASLRAITERAEANLAAVSYHFGGKEGLLEAVIKQAIGGINEERMRRFAALEDQGTITVEAVVSAMLEPILRVAQPQRLSAMFGLFARLHLEAPESVLPIFDRHLGPVLARFIDMIAACQTGLDRHQICCRTLFSGGSLGKYMMLFVGEAAPLPPFAADVPQDPAVVLEELIAFVSAGLGGR